MARRTSRPRAKTGLADSRFERLSGVGFFCGLADFLVAVFVAAGLILFDFFMIGRSSSRDHVSIVA
jgi:hypothetical protein